MSTITKHAPPRPYKQNETSHVVFVNALTPYMSAVKRVEKRLDGLSAKPNRKGQYVNRKTNYVTVKGMGKAINTVLNVAVHFKFEKRHRVQIYTKTIGVLDEIEEDLKKRNVGEVEIHIFLQ